MVIRRRLTSAPLALAVVATIGLSTPATVILAAAPAVAAPVDAATRAEVADIADEARSLRRDVSRTMQDYARTYRSELTASEKRLLDSFVTTADRRLGDVVRETGRLESTVSRSRSLTQVEQAQSRSQSAWARAQMAAEESFDSARGILEPHMSLGDKIEALADYTTLMRRFEDLGERIDTLDID